MTSPITKTTHTPGEWEFAQDSGTNYGYDAYVFATPQSVSRRIADVCNLADARLIAAAPDLLEALRALLAMCDDDRYGTHYPLDDVNRITGIARAALARVEGGE